MVQTDRQTDRQTDSLQMTI